LHGSGTGRTRSGNSGGRLHFFRYNCRFDVKFVQFPRPACRLFLVKVFLPQCLKILAFRAGRMYNNKACDIDSYEARGCCGYPQVFPWSECQVRKLAASHCTNLFKAAIIMRVPDLRDDPGNTRISVQSPLVAVLPYRI